MQDGRGSSRRARRTARPSAARRRPARARGRARRAGACRPRARAAASWRSRRGAPSRAAARCGRAGARRGDARELQRELDVAAHRQPREQRGFLEHERRCGWRRTSTVPDVGWSRPATRLSSVLLPQPDAPSRQTNSPGATSRRDAVERDAPRSAPCPNDLARRRRSRRPDAPPDPAGGAGSEVASHCSEWTMPFISRLTAGFAAVLEDLVQQLQVVDALEVADRLEKPSASAFAAPLLQRRRRSGRA